jgi:hypothetical protein
LSLTAQVASVYLTVLVSVERYVAVCKPFKARVWFSWRKSSLFSVAVIFFSILYNFPTWFELGTRRKYSEGVFLGLASYRTALYRDSTYVFYYVNLGSFLVIRLIPFALLVVLNSFIYNAVRSSKVGAKLFLLHFSLLSDSEYEQNEEDDDTFSVARSGRCADAPLCCYSILSL